MANKSDEYNYSPEFIFQTSDLDNFINNNFPELRKTRNGKYMEYEDEIER